MSTETTTATEYTVGTKVRVIGSPTPALLPNGATGTIEMNIGPAPDEDHPLLMGATGDRLFVRIDGGDVEALLASEVEVVED